MAVLWVIRRREVMFRLCGSREVFSEAVAIVFLWCKCMWLWCLSFETCLCFRPLCWWECEWERISDYDYGRLSLASTVLSIMLFDWKSRLEFTSLFVVFNFSSLSKLQQTEPRFPAYCSSCFALTIPFTPLATRVDIFLIFFLVFLLFTLGFVF